MSKVLPLGFLAMALMLPALPRAARAATADQVQIQALYTKFTRDVRHKDLNGIMSAYVHDTSLFVFDATPPREHVGWDDYRNDWKSVLALFKGEPKFDVSELQITSSGDVAYTRSVQHVRSSLNNGQVLDVVLRVTDVLRKAQGRWFIVQEHVSVPVDITTGKADLQSRP
jgi:ketosteroid isomerase-like protein